jgi:hypothetical protein
MPRVSAATFGARVARDSFEDDELGVGESGVRDGIARVDRDGALEIADGRGVQIEVEALDFQPALGVGTERLEALRFTDANLRRMLAGRQADLAFEGEDNAVLQREDVGELSVHFRIRENVAAPQVDQVAP